MEKKILKALKYFMFIIAGLMILFVIWQTQFKNFTLNHNSITTGLSHEPNVKYAISKKLFDLKHPGEEYKADLHKICLKIDTPEMVAIVIILIMIGIFFYKKRNYSRENFKSKTVAHHSMNIKKEWMHMLIYPAVLGVLLEQMISAVSPIIEVSNQVFNESWYFEDKFHGIAILLKHVLFEEHFLLGLAFVTYFSIDFLFTYLASTTETYDRLDLFLDLFISAMLLVGFVSLNITGYNSGDEDNINFPFLLYSTFAASATMLFFETRKWSFFIEAEEAKENENPDDKIPIELTTITRWKKYYIWLSGAQFFVLSLIAASVCYYFLQTTEDSKTPQYLQNDQIPLRLHICIMAIWITSSFLMLIYRRYLGYQDENQIRLLIFNKRADECKVLIEKEKKTFTGKGKIRKAFLDCQESINRRLLEKKHKRVKAAAAKCREIQKLKDTSNGSQQQATPVVETAK